jgi:hypothetical protein
VIAIGFCTFGSAAKTESSNPDGSFAVLTTSLGSIGLAKDFSEFTIAGNSSAAKVFALESQNQTRNAQTNDVANTRRANTLTMKSYDGRIDRDASSYTIALQNSHDILIGL